MNTPKASKYQVEAKCDIVRTFTERQQYVAADFLHRHFPFHFAVSWAQLGTEQ